MIVNGEKFFYPNFHEKTLSMHFRESATCGNRK